MNGYKKYATWSVGLCLGLMAFGCGAARVPKELADARAEYAKASEGETAKVAPAELHVAKVALDQAEKHFKDDPDDHRTLDLAYVAHRKVLLAESQAGLMMAEKQKQQATAANQRAQQERLAQASQQLNQARGQLETERGRREQAETSANDAMKRLEEANAVKHEERGLVITLSGSVLFASGKAGVLPTAESRLDEVAEALKDQPGRIIVEGHTDSVGSERSNMQLSRLRAQSVVDVLVAHGVPRDRLEAVGYGETRPITDNNSAEGRANNRRVEIIVNPKSVPASQLDQPRSRVTAQTSP